MVTKTKSTLKWQTKGHREAEAKFRASEDHSASSWPTISIHLSDPECPRYLRLVEEYKAADADWRRRYIREGDESLKDKRPERPGRCWDCDECNAIPDEGWRITSYWRTYGLLYESEVAAIREENREEWRKEWLADRTGTVRSPDDRSIDELAAYAKKWGQTEPYPTLPQNVWVFGTRKEAQAKAEELAQGLDAQIEAWFAPIIAAKEAKEAARKAKVKTQHDAEMAELEKNREFMARLKELIPGLEGSGQWKGIHIDNPEKLLEALS